MAGLFDLTDRVAVVTAAAQGLGQSMAMALAEHGADVLVADLDHAGASATAAAITQLGRRALPCACDVANPGNVRELFQKLDREFGRLDFLAHVTEGGVLGLPEDITLAEVQMTWHRIALSAFSVCREAGLRMLPARRGSIVNVASIAGVSALGRGHVAVSMAMGAVVQLTRELSTEWASRGVRVNAILPAQIADPLLSQHLAERPQLIGRYLGGIPAGRLGRPDDIRGITVLLASDTSEWISGALIPMDGGNLASNLGATIGVARG